MPFKKIDYIKMNQSVKTGFTGLHDWLMKGSIYLVTDLPGKSTYAQRLLDEGLADECDASGKKVQEAEQPAPEKAPVIMKQIKKNTAVTTVTTTMEGEK